MICWMPRGSLLKWTVAMDDRSTYTMARPYMVYTVSLNVLACTELFTFFYALHSRHRGT